MVPVNATDFAAHLRLKTGRALALSGGAESAAAGAAEPGFRALWEASELSATDFADEVACFFSLPRVALPDLLGARPLLDRFSRRFVREMTIFPCEDGTGAQVLAVADPSNSAAIQAAMLAAEPPPCMVTEAGVSLPRASASLAWATVSVIRSPMTTTRAIAVLTSQC